MRHMYRKNISGQFADDVLLDTLAQNINLNTLPTYSLCAISTGKICLVNLLKMSRFTPPPKLLVLTRCRRYLSVPYVQGKIYLANLLTMSCWTP